MLPDWIGIPHCKLYAAYSSKRSFSMQEAKEVTGKPKKLLRKILSELGKRGLLVSVDGGYYLPDFEGFCLGVKLRDELEGIDPEEKLRRAESEYLIVGSYAAFLYHEYQFPSRHRIKVKREDYGLWYNLLDFKIDPSLTGQEYENRRELDGLSVAPPERVFVEGVAKGSADSILDSVSLALSVDIDWDEVVKLAMEKGVEREVGALLRILNQRSKSRIAPRKTIDELRSQVKKIGRAKEFPRNVLVQERTFSEWGKKWHLELTLPRYVIEKPIEELMP
ncbi:hypothetical protein AKJ57_02110 [candidate division MSBL1 archaeon SCGC-AAA259A05]|uniref:AbiEi antitoxin C-terminal domain-containing protein n=1 Tax=candidate division MSBL1 archaeon SCGC-AAA259A05 TaxID=1698259 RepID=A0A133UAI6_9EURY|nr:hypothetical protein AKJ57_02110 [candidate division MSBL1 archaeon SCGC-AAA259A05]